MATKVRTLLIAAAVMASLGLTGCTHYTCGVTFGNSTCSSNGGGLSQGGTSFTQTALVYFVDPGAGQMAAEGMNVNNSQNFVPLSSFQTPTLPQKEGGAIAIVGKAFVFVQFLNGQLFGFSINKSTGALTPISNASPYSVTGSTIAADPKGQFLFVGDVSGITMFTVGGDGSLTKIGTFSTGGILPVQLATDATGKYLYALDGNEIVAYAYTAGGMVQVSGSPFTSGSNTQFGVVQLVPDNNGAFMFGITQQEGASGGIVDNHIYVFGISSGALVPVAGSPFATTNAPAWIAASPVGPYVYAFTETFSGTAGNTLTLDPIEGFSFDTAGVLTPLTSSPFTTILASMGMFDQSGTYIFTVGQETNATAAGMIPLTVSSNGSITVTPTHQGVVSSIYAVTDEP